MLKKPQVAVVIPWGLASLLLMAVVFYGGRADVPAQIIAALCISTLIGHLFQALGRKDAIGFVVCCLAVTFTIENIGVRTGFPFGHYKFLVAPSLPHVGVIPIIVGALYLSMGYASWVVANLILGSLSADPRGNLRLFALPIAAAFIMVQWDAVMDPAGSTLGRAWAWFDSGGYFGVPLSNFFGWFLINWIFLQIFSVFQRFRRHYPSAACRSRIFWAFPVLLYLAAGLSHVAPLFDPPGVLLDAGGRTWQSADLRETAVIVMSVTMLPTSLLALFNLARAGAHR